MILCNNTIEAPPPLVVVYPHRSACAYIKTTLGATIACRTMIEDMKLDEFDILLSNSSRKWKPDTIYGVDIDCSAESSSRGAPSDSNTPVGKAANSKTANGVKKIKVEKAFDDEQQRLRCKYAIRDSGLKTRGLASIENGMYAMRGFNSFVKSHMAEWQKKRLLKGAKIALNLQVNQYNANLVLTLKRMGADIRWCSSNVKSTDDEVAAAMVSNGISIFAWYDQSNEDLEWCMKQVVSSADWSPTIILEKGYNLTNLMLRNSPSPSNSNTHLSHIGFKGVIDCSLTAMKESEGLKKLGLLNFIAFNLYTNPVIRLMEKRLMPRESIVNILTMGGLRTIICKNIIIIGYGVMGQTISNTLRHANCTVYVVEIDPIKALKASIDGFKVRKIEEIVKVADYIICCSNSQMVISSDILKIIKDEAFICNMGNENQEIDVNWIRANCITKPVSKHLEKATLKHRPKSFFFLCKGMQASKFLQATPPIVESVKCLASLLAIMEMNMSKGTKYDFNTYSLPIDIDKFNAKLHLEDFNVAVSESKH